MNSKVSIHKYPKDYSESHSSWTGGMVSYDSKPTVRNSRLRKDGSDSVPYEYQPHQSKNKKIIPIVGSNNEKEASSKQSMKTIHSQQPFVEDSPRSTTSVSSHEFEMEEEVESNLWSLDVYIHEVSHFIYKTTNPLLSNDSCIGFRLWEFPLMYIQKPEGPYGRDDTIETKMFKEGFKQTSFYGSGLMRNQEKVTSHNLLFRKGKSVVFTMERMELSQYIQTLPLYVFLFILTASPGEMSSGSMVDPNMGNSNWKPVLIGSISIPLNDLRVFDEVDAPKGTRVPQKRTISGTFTIKNDRGYDVGVIDMDVRLRSLIKAGPIEDFNEYLSHNFSKSFSLQRPMTTGGPHSSTMDRSSRMQTGAVSRNPLFTVTDNTFQQQTVQNTFNPMLGTTMANGELGQLSNLVQQYKDTQTQTMMMRGQIENQITTMASQLAEISRQLKGEPERFVEERQTKKLKKKTSTTGKILNSQPIKRPSSVNSSRSNSLSNNSKAVDTLSTRKKNVTLGRNTNSYLEQPTKEWYHVLHGTSSVRKPQSSFSSKSSISKKKAPLPSGESKAKVSKKVDKSLRLEEELARHVLENLQQPQQEDDERQGTTLSGVIPQLAETLNLLARKAQKNEEESEELITIPSELYRTIKENNDRYNNLQKSYQLIMEEFVDNPNKLFSSLTKVDTRGMSFREKELWKNQNKLITLLRDNYNAIKKEKDMSALKDVKRSQKRSPILESSIKKPTRKVEEIEGSESDSSSSEGKKKEEKNKGKQEQKENEIHPENQLHEEEYEVITQFKEDYESTPPVIEVEEPHEEYQTPTDEPESYEYPTNQVKSAEDFLKQYEEEEDSANDVPQLHSSQMYQTQTNQNPMEMMTATEAYLPLRASLGVSEIKTAGETESSFEDFEEFDNSHFDNSEAPQSDTLRTEDFSVVHVSQDNPENTNNFNVDQSSQNQQVEVEEEEFEDFENDFEDQPQNDPEDETYDEQQDGHQEVVDSVDYSGIEDRTEEERI